MCTLSNSPPLHKGGFFVYAGLLITKQDPVCCKFLFLLFCVKLQQSVHGHIVPFFPLQGENDRSAVHHDCAVAGYKGLLHVMCNHQCGQIAALYNPVGDFHDFFLANK